MKWNFSLPTFFRHKSLLLWWFLKAKLILKHKVELEGNYRLTLKKRKGEKKTFSQENIPHQIRMEGGPSSFLTFDLKIKEVFFFFPISWEAVSDQDPLLSEWGFPIWYPEKYSFFSFFRGEVFVRSKKRVSSSIDQELTERPVFTKAHGGIN